MRFRAFERETVTRVQREMLAGNPEIERPAYDDPRFDTVVAVVAAVCADINRTHQHFQRAAEVGRQQFLLDTKLCERQLSSLVRSDDDVFFVRWNVASVEKPIYLDTKRRAYLFQDADRKLSLVTLDLA